MIRLCDECVMLLYVLDAHGEKYIHVKPLNLIADNDRDKVIYCNLYDYILVCFMMYVI